MVPVFNPLSGVSLETLPTFGSLWGRRRRMAQHRQLAVTAGCATAQSVAQFQISISSAWRPSAGQHGACHLSNKVLDEALWMIVICFVCCTYPLPSSHTISYARMGMSVPPPKPRVPH